jgi:multidrug resistance protein
VRRERAPRGRGRRAGASLPPGFGTIWLTVALDLVGFGIILPILPLYGERFGASPVVIGLLVAAFSAAQFVFAPLLGRLSDRIGRKPVILVSLFGTAVGSLITGLAWAVWVLFLGRIIDGASGASVSVAQGAVTDLAPPPERPRLLGLLGAAFGVGFVLGPALGGLAAVVGERVPFFVAAFVAFVNALVAMRRLPETHPRFRTDATVTAWSSGVWPAATAEVADAKPDPRRRHDLVALFVVAFCATAAFAGFEATFSLFGQDRFDLTEGTVAPVFVAMGLALVVVQGGLIRPITERLGTPATLRFGLVTTALGLLVLAPARTWPVLALALALLVLGQGLTTPTLSSAVANRSRGSDRGRNLGYQQSAGALARIVGPAVAGVLFQHVGIPAPYLVGAGVVGLALALLATTGGRFAESVRPATVG